jgi:hypothetical protein
LRGPRHAKWFIPNSVSASGFLNQGAALSLRFAQRGFRVFAFICNACFVGEFGFSPLRKSGQPLERKTAGANSCCLDQRVED